MYALGEIPELKEIFGHPHKEFAFDILPDIWSCADVCYDRMCIVFGVLFNIV